MYLVSVNCRVKPCLPEAILGSSGWRTLRFLISNILGQCILYVVCELRCRVLLVSNNPSPAWYNSDCKSLNENDTWAAKSVVLCFTTAFREGSVEEAASSFRKAGGLGLIVAENPSRSWNGCGDDFPCVQVSYDIGMNILYYIRSSRYSCISSLLVIFVR